MDVTRTSSAGFVNRQRELDYLRSFVPPHCSESSAIIIKSPSGFGKSALTKRLLSDLPSEVSYVFVDPDIRSSRQDVRIYEGFFIQKMAKALSAMDGNCQSFDSFLRERRWDVVAAKNPIDSLARLPSLATLYESGVDYFKRLTETGEYSADALLASESAIAVGLCADYVESTCRSIRLLTIIREAQHIDYQSLRYILQLNRILPMQQLIIEYTTRDGSIEPRHWDAIKSQFTGNDRAHIVDLHQLGRSSLEELVRREVTPAFRLTSEHYATWNGNLRIVEELKFADSMTPDTGNAFPPLTDSLPDFLGILNARLAKLSRNEQFALSIIAAHIEAISRRTMTAVAQSVEQFCTIAMWNAALDGLRDRHRLIVESNSTLRLENEDLAAAIEEHADLRGLLQLARVAIKDYYLSLINASDYRTVSMSVAIRLVFSMCAQMRDPDAILAIIGLLSEHVKAASDPSLYVDAALAAVSENDALALEDCQTILQWTSSIAYDTGDFRRAADSLELCAPRNVRSAALQACALIEVGQHARAVELADEYLGDSQDVSVLLCLSLIKMFASRDLGDAHMARQMLDETLSDPKFRSSPLLGYALRFAQSLKEPPEATSYVLESIEWFDRYGLMQSRAYSELTAIMDLARAGRLHEARELLNRASSALAAYPREHHTILNNNAAIMMLTENPDFDACEELLLSAMRTSRDDFSDIALLNNLAIVNLKRHRDFDAVRYADRMLNALSTAQFSESDIKWGAHFTAIQVFSAVGEKGRADAVRALYRPAPIVNARYWSARFGGTKIALSPYTSLLKAGYHAMFLGHWSIEREGIELLPE
jgi:hypothetical protein